MRRIGVAVVLALSFGLAPLPLDAQQAAQIAKIGFLTPVTPAAAAFLVEAFRQGLRNLGHVEGKTFALEVRYGEGKSERLPDLARELVGLKVDVIVTTSDAATAAVKRETRTIPIVMASSVDPVGTGFVASLARPGRNITGVSSVSSELSGKRLALLKEVVPGLSRVAVLWNPDVRGALFDYKESEAAARTLHLELQSLEVFTAQDLDHAFSTVISQRAQALVLLATNPVTYSKQAEIASFTQKKSVAVHVPSQDVRGRGWPDVLRTECSRDVSPRGHVRR
jgi:putative ABC transport system substrate-binding protein